MLPSSTENYKEFYNDFTEEILRVQRRKSTSISTQTSSANCLGEFRRSRKPFSSSLI
jgi:hypothetical protein